MVSVILFYFLLIIFVKSISFVFLSPFLIVHFVFGLLPFLKKMGGREFQEIRMMSLTLCFI